MAALEGLGVRARRLSGAEFHAWLTRWFNAWTDLTPDDPAAFARTFLDDGAIPYGDGFAESLFYAHPRSDAANGCWVFDRTAMRVLGVEGLRRAPAIGHVTGETRHGDAVNAVLDELPEGTVYATALVPVPQDLVDAHVERIEAAATGESADAMRARADCRTAKEIMGERHKLYRFSVAFYLRAPLGRGPRAARGRGAHRAPSPRVPGHRPGGRPARPRRVPRAPADGLRPGRRPAGGVAPRAPRLGAARGERVAGVRARARHRGARVCRSSTGAGSRSCSTR